MPFSVVIPARYASTRLPGKPLLEVGGRSMIERVWRRARQSGAERVLVATDDARIRDAAEQFGAEVCMTDPAHPSGTDRLQEVARTLELADDAILVNVQGDEPLIPALVINQVATNLAANPDCGVATLCVPIRDSRELHNPNAVKVVFDARGRALYFSRAAIPWPRDSFAADPEAMPAGDHWYRHIGIYAYRVSFLHRHVSWAPAPLERLEQLEQLRALYHGVAIHVAPAAVPVPAGVDTAADLAAVNALLVEMPHE
ncbi:3-deoxy-manno-octulosonate cytidylyltransferase [Haliea sp. E1-2-M8]|uniref:3-deoxy-manno-octulosonate cytidylyltransferase n=1 Tax=Haliea sp. E1-2-M8 TaxID=3064706 RepID=UPI00271AFE80|nr:3-deoxy-manno-octulosonate cytidylyltransferase [Haliea sp. E1-2-M8]MDO8862388.1 3-deoxy-manno-octulosonate cytidylyltransferase [Haliea sp. E1-2-M8]